MIIAGSSPRLVITDTSKQPWYAYSRIYIKYVILINISQYKLTTKLGNKFNESTEARSPMLLLPEKWFESLQLVSTIQISLEYVENDIYQEEKYNITQ